MFASNPFTRLGAWLAEARYVWLALTVVVISLALSLRPNTPEHVIRLTGLGLQLLGITTVAWGISETRALFGHPSVSSKVKAWFSRFPFLSREPIVGSMNATLSFDFICNARGYTMHGPGIPPTIESRVDALEKNLILIQDRISQTQGEMDGEFRKIIKLLKSEVQFRQEEDAAIRARLETTATGGVHISAIGAVLLFVGVILGTASVEIAGWLK